MKIQYCSDLHIEFDLNNKYLLLNPLKKSGDVLILAGDVAPFIDDYFDHPFISFISEKYDQVFWVPGNHEFYYKDIADYNISYNIRIRENISIVNNIDIEYKNVRFIFSTLWSKISAKNEKVIEKGVSDYICIANKGKNLTVKDSNFLHSQCKTFLQESLKKKQHKTIVVTHHLPSDLCNAPQHKNSPVNEAFCTDYTDLIADSNVNFWIYGHSHFNQKPLYIGNTLLLTNQLGYVEMNEHKGYRNNAYFVV